MKVQALGEAPRGNATEVHENLGVTREAGIAERKVLPVGTRIGDGDRYEIRRKVGHGAMAEVYQAIDRRLNGRIVAVKTMSAAIAQHPFRDRMRALFIEEAQALSRVRDDNVVAVLDSGTAPDGTPYMVMEYLTGQDLAGLLKEQKQLPVERAVEIMLAVCAGVHGCHLAGIIHRDLKPANVFLDQTPKGEQPKVLDFSVAKVPVSRDQTQTDLIVGTPNYMSPEQALGRPADERSDQYSVGALLYRCLTGRPPKGLLASPREIRPDVPEALEFALLRAMDPIPGNRFGTVHDLGKDLLPFASQAGRVRWQPYYSAVPVAVPAIASGRVEVPGGTAAEVGTIATKVVPYDFESHERTTKTAAPPAGADVPTSAESAPPTEDPATVSTLQSMGLHTGTSSVGLASTVAASSNPVSATEATGSDGAARPLSETSSKKRRYIIRTAAVGGVLLVGIAVALRFGAGRQSPPPPSPPSWTRTALPDQPSSAPRPPTVIHAVPEPQAGTPPPARTTNLTELPRQRGEVAGTQPSDQKPRKQASSLRQKAERDKSARRRPWLRPVDNTVDASSYPAVGNTSDSKYPAMP